jgi:signal transduction histidine kinase
VTSACVAQWIKVRRNASLSARRWLWYTGARMRLGVRQKLVLLSLLILVVVSFTFAALQLGLSRTWREEDLQERAVIFAREIAATIGDHHELEAGALIDRKIHQIMAVRQSVLQLDIVRLPPGGAAVVATSEPGQRLPFTAADETAVRKGAVISRLLSGGAERSWEVMAPIKLDGAVAGAVAARFSLGRFDAREARSRTLALWLTAVSVLVMGSLMTLAVHGVVNRPIERFVQAMRGAEAEPVAVAANDEFGAMARHFNDMIARARERLFAMQRDLSHAERLALSGRIVAEVAHEVGTPLHSVMGHLELLREDLPAAALSETIERRLRVIESQLGRLREIIDRLLDLTRRSPQPAVPVDVSAIVEETLELVRPAVAAARLTLTVEADAALPRLLAQRSELQQVVLNLLTNALDATPPGGTIHVSTHLRGDDVEIAVADTGCGIPTPELKRVFDPFVTTKDPQRGTGLGLFICAQIVHDHGGHIDVSSEPGYGSTFRVLLPAERITA